MLIDNVHILLGLDKRKAIIGFYEKGRKIKQLYQFNDIALKTWYPKFSKQWRKDKIKITISKLGKINDAIDWNIGYANDLFLMGKYDEALKEFDKSEKYSKINTDTLQLINIKLYKGDLYIHLRQKLFSRN